MAQAYAERVIAFGDAGAIAGLRARCLLARGTIAGFGARCLTVRGFIPDVIAARVNCVGVRVPGRAVDPIAS
jgi:hypothetical protein